MNNKLIIFGAGSGLGLEVYKEISKNKKFFSDVFIFSRKNTLELNADHFFQADFSKKEQWPIITEKVKILEATHFWYFAGGGPYGFFHEKKWVSHEWAINVNFLFPMFLSHALLNNSNVLKQLIFVGSAIAENQTDPQALSYSAAKHGLMGLVLNLINDYNNLDVRLFSPGYMNTSMLPANSVPVKNGQALDPADVAIQFINWTGQSEPKHFIV